MVPPIMGEPALGSSHLIYQGAWCKMNKHVPFNKAS